MNREQYMIEIQRTWSTDWTQAEQFANAALGLTGELNEYRKAIDTIKRGEELGDALYYCATPNRLTNRCDFPYPFEVSEYSDAAIVDVSIEVGELIKKMAFHRVDVEASIVSRLVFIERCIETDANQYHDGIESVRTQNIAKLRARYPDGFVPGGCVR